MPTVSVPTQGLSTFVSELAKRHSVRYEPTGTAALAQAITRLAGDEAVPDPTERLIIALRRAKIIDGPAMLDLQGRYLDEKFHVQPVRPVR